MKVGICFVQLKNSFVLQPVKTPYLELILARKLYPSTNRCLIIFFFWWWFFCSFVLLRPFKTFCPFFLLSNTSSFVGLLINKILMTSAKLATSDLLEIKMFWNKSHDSITSVHGITTKVLSRGSNYIVDVVM